MSNKKQTAVEELIEKLIAKSKENDPNNFTVQIYFESNKDIIEQANKMFEQQIIEAFEEGKDIEYEYHINDEPRIDAEQYYKETFNK